MAETKNEETVAPVTVVQEKRNWATPLIAALVVVVALVLGGAGGFALASVTHAGARPGIEQEQLPGSGQNQGPGGPQGQGGPQQGPGGGQPGGPQQGPGQGQHPPQPGDDSSDDGDDTAQG